VRQIIGAGLISGGDNSTDTPEGGAVSP